MIPVSELAAIIELRRLESLLPWIINRKSSVQDVIFLPHRLWRENRVVNRTDKKVSTNDALFLVPHPRQNQQNQREENHDHDRQPQQPLFVYLYPEIH